MRKNYEEEALKLSKAIDIAIDSFKKFPPEIWNEKTLNHIINFYIELKERTLNPKPQYKKIASLKYKIQEAFTMFEESNGKYIEYFWKQIEAQNLDYPREDKLAKILLRGKIRGRIEFEYLIDVIVSAEQEKRITSDEAKKLGSMLGEFELKKRR